MKIDIGLNGLACFGLELPLVQNQKQENEVLLPASIKSAAFVRRNEFIAGRFCARFAGDELGLSIRALPVGPNRAPLWPAGIVGSISHSRKLAIACVGKSSSWRSVGIDTEIRLDRASARNIAPVIACEEEQRMISEFTSRDQELAYTILFSAKEAFYKAMHPLYRKFIDFKEVQLEQLCLRSGRLSLRSELSSKSFEGRFLLLNSNVITVLPVGFEEKYANT